MKKFPMPNIYKLCTLCMALTTVITARHASFVFFGEPKFPTEE